MVNSASKLGVGTSRTGHIKVSDNRRASKIICDGIRIALNAFFSGDAGRTNSRYRGFEDGKIR